MAALVSEAGTRAPAELQQPQRQKKTTPMPRVAYSGVSVGPLTLLHLLLVGGSDSCLLGSSN